MQLSGQVALLVGGAGGIGQAIALALAREGADVAVADVNVDRAEQVAAELRRLRCRGLALHLDVTLEPSVADGINRVTQQLGEVDLLVTLAAVIDQPSPIWEMSKETWDRSLAVELTGTFLVCRELLRRMIPRKRGRIVNISSVAGKFAYPLRASYAVAKAGTIRLTECLAREAGPYGILANAICPGPTEGERLEQIIANRAAATGRETAEIEAEYRNTTVLGEFPRPDDIAGLVVYLASPAGSHITGQAIDIDSGYLLR
jgi:NAD(P)-dependent dehydrogenase (short-subunit alcohol dehydrogenase family)